MRDSLRTFCLRQLYQNSACSSKELVELAVQHGYLEASTKDHYTKLLSVLAGIPREERLNNDRFFPGGLAEFRAYDSLVAVLAQSRTLGTTLLRPLLGAVNLALHQDRRFYCLDDGSWYLQHQTIVNDELFAALQEKDTEVSLKAWLETYITQNPGTAPAFWSLDPRFVLEGEQVRLHAHCTLLGAELENLWPAWEAQFAHGARVSTESLSQAFQDDCVPSPLALEQVLALKGVYPIGNDLWMHEAFIPDVPSVGGAVAFRVSDTLQEEPLAFPSLLVLDSLGMGEVVLTAAHRIYGVLPISYSKAERLYQATGLGLGLGLKPEDNTFEVWHKDGFLFSEALAQRLALLGPGQRLRLSVTEEGLSFELRGFDTRLATAQNGLFSREELLLPHSGLSASLLAQVQAEPEGINLSTLIANLGPDYSVSEITLALTSPLIERGPGGFCRYHPLSFDPQEAVLALLQKSLESQPQDLSKSPTILERQEGPIVQDEFSLTEEEEEETASSEDALMALLNESPEPQSPEAWMEFQEENVEPYINLKEAELLELIQEQDLAPEETSSPVLEQATDRVQDADQALLQTAAPHVMQQSLHATPIAEAPSLDTPPVSEETVASKDEKKTFLPLSLEELFSLQSEEEAEDGERIPLGQDIQVLEEESEEDLTELMHSLYAEPEAHTTDVQPIASELPEVQTLQPEKEEDHAPEVLPVAQEGDNALQMIAPEIIEQSVEQPAELGIGLAEEKEDVAQPTISAELAVEVTEKLVVELQATEPAELLEEVEETLPFTQESVVSYSRLEDLALVLTGEELVAPVEPIASVEVKEPVILEIHPIPTDTPVAADVEEEAVLFAPEPIVVLNLEDLVLDLTGEKPVALETSTISVEDTFECFEEIHIEEIHEPIQAAPEPTSFLWIDELRMDLIKGEAPPQMPTEIPSVTTTSSPEAIAFLNILFEEERKEPVLENEGEEETSKRPSPSLQAKLDQLVVQREAILAQRQPAWTTLMQSVIAQATLSPQQQEEFQGVWMGTQPLQSHALCPSVEPYLCQLTVLNRLPAAGSLDLFVQALKEHVVLGAVDPTGVLESLILPSLQYQRTAEGWAQKLA